MANSTRTMSILLADLVGSTRQVSQITTQRAAEYIDDATRPIENAVKLHHGKLVKFTGDGFLATFDSAQDALICADAIRDHYIRQRRTPGGYAIDGVRVVVNTADVVCEDDDVIGDGVVVCARLEKNVPTNQVWLTAATREVVGVSDFVFQPVGDVQLRGRPQPVTVYALENTEQSFIEYGVVLMATDLHRYVHAGETLAPVALNDWLARWMNLHREAIMGLSGQVRQFVADMALLSFAKPDDAIQAALNLHSLTSIYNRETTASLQYHFKVAIATGDLILSPTGVVGRLVNRTFDLLNATPRESVVVDAEAYALVKDYADTLEPISLASSHGEDFQGYKLRQQALSQERPDAAPE
ncbi:MAG: hypothetical protein GYB66_00535 [Chloroflexi bacterium]|nr:hypothetical protein [Chloroflexota bacterium]